MTRPSRRLAILAAVVLCNYLAQIPYSLHLYGLSADRRGAVLREPPSCGSSPGSDC